MEGYILAAAVADTAAAADMTAAAADMKVAAAAADSQDLVAVHLDTMIGRRDFALFDKRKR